MATLALATEAVTDLAHRGLVDHSAAASTREAGVMLFTFVTDPPAQHPPMRVRVFQALVRCLMFTPLPNRGKPGIVHIKMSDKAEKLVAVFGRLTYEASHSISTQSFCTSESHDELRM